MTLAELLIFLCLSLLICKPGVILAQRVVVRIKSGDVHKACRTVLDTQHASDIAAFNYTCVSCPARPGVGKLPPAGRIQPPLAIVNEFYEHSHAYLSTHYLHLRRALLGCWGRPE